MEEVSCIRGAAHAEQYYDLSCVMLYPHTLCRYRMLLVVILWVDMPIIRSCVIGYHDMQVTLPYNRKHGLHFIPVQCSWNM